jgi:hypothetical protein
MVVGVKPIGFVILNWRVGEANRVKDLDAIQ